MTQWVEVRQRHYRYIIQSKQRENFLISIPLDSFVLAPSTWKKENRKRWRCRGQREESRCVSGWKFFNECPREPRIPIYMVVGGTFGSMFMTLSIYSQIRSRRPEVVMAQPQEPQISFTKLITVILSFFLLGWFVMGKFRRNSRIIRFSTLPYTILYVPSWYPDDFYLCRVCFPRETDRSEARSRRSFSASRDPRVLRLTVLSF